MHCSAEGNGCYKFFNLLQWGFCVPLRVTAQVIVGPSAVTHSGWTEPPMGPERVISIILLHASEAG